MNLCFTGKIWIKDLAGNKFSYILNFYIEIIKVQISSQNSVLVGGVITWAASGKSRRSSTRVGSNEQSVTSPSGGEVWDTPLGENDTPKATEQCCISTPLFGEGVSIFV